MSHLRRNPKVVGLIFVIFSIGGFALLLADESRVRVIGIAMLLMFGVTGIGWWLGESGWGAKQPTLSRLKLPGGSSIPAVVLSVSRTKEFQGLLTMLGIGSAALLLVANPEALGRRGGPITQLIFGAIGVFFLVYLPFHIRKLRKRQLDLWLFRDGIQQRDLIVFWADIVDMKRYDIYGQPYLGLDVSPTDEDRKSPKSISQQLEGTLTGYKWSIWLGGYAIPADRVQALVEDYWRSPDHRLRIQPAGPTIPEVSIPRAPVR
jgi:hypothetical protein